MTTFVQHPNDAIPNGAPHAVQDPRIQQYIPPQASQQQMLSRQHPAPHIPPYPDQDQLYQQSGSVQQPDQVPPHNQRSTYLAVTSYGPITSEADYSQQLRPALAQQRSEASFRSAHSHKSTRSTGSHHSHHSTKSSHSHRSHHPRHDASRELKGRKRERDIDVRPTMGDSVMLVVNHFRDLLSGDRR